VLAEGLRRLADNYEYEKLTKLLEPKGGDSGHAA